MSLIKLLEELHLKIGNVIKIMKVNYHQAGDVVLYLPSKKATNRKLGYVIQVREIMDIYSISDGKTVEIEADAIRKTLSTKDDEDYHKHIVSVPLGFIESNS